MPGALSWVCGMVGGSCYQLLVGYYNLALGLRH